MRHRIAISTPDSLAAFDLHEHLHDFNAHVSPAGDGTARVLVETRASPIVVLRAVQEWADVWNHLHELEVEVNRRPYILHGRSLHWTRDAIVFPL
jgi:hypothetical protein